MKIKTDYVSSLTLAILALTIVGAMAWQLSTYYYADDFCYMRKFINDSQDDFWSCVGPLNKSISDVATSISNHYIAANGRLANMVVFVVLLFPLWVVKSCAGITMAAFFILSTYFGWRCTANSSGRLVVLALSAALFWLVYPWYESCQSYAFQTNYVLPSACVLLFILLWRRVGRMSVLHFSIYCIFAVLTAWMHEAFTCPLIAASFFAVIFKAENRRRHVLLLLALAVGLLLTMSPGTIARASATVSVSRSYGPVLILSRVLAQAWIVWLATAMLVIKCCRRQCAPWASETLVPFLLLTGAWTGIAQCLVLQVAYRALWPAELFASVAVLAMVGAHVSSPSFKVSKLCFAALSFLACIYAVWLVSLVKWQIRFATEQKQMFTHLIESKEKDISTIFFDRTFERDVPFWLMRIVNHPFETGGLANYMMALSAGYPDAVFITIPTSYANVPYEDWPQLDGTAEMKHFGRTFISKKLYNGPFRVYAGESYPSDTPFDKVFASVKSLVSDDVYSARPKSFIWPVTLPDKSKAYYYQLQILPRAIENRKIVRIDTIPEID